ncbi:MAG: hypothetical protein GKR87_11500 [Kiritimatiellae bacterium]|nr:hypothetical protein [Kiritimatiellia bacterium]
MNGSVTHDRSEETPEAKARWFRSLPLVDRMDMLCSLTDLALTANPSLRTVNMLNRLQDVFKSFQKYDVKYYDVKYVVIGEIASILHGVPHATFGLDILIEATPDNAKRLLDALQDAKLGTASLTSVRDILAHEITIFKDRVRIDVQTFTPGIDDFTSAWQRRHTVTYQGQNFSFFLKLISSLQSKR